MTAMISLLFWLAVIPFCIGLIPANLISSEKRSPGFVFLSGYFIMWAIFELAAVPAVLWVEYQNFKTASAVFTVLTLLCAAVGIWLLYRNAKAGRPGLVTRKMRSDSDGTGKENDKRVSQAGGLKVCTAAFGKWLLHAAGIEWLLFFILLAFQLYKAVAYASFDGDDAYYVVESLIAQEADVMYRILPLTGGSTGLDVRHAMAVFPMWVAFVSTRAGMHATIVSHVLMPLVLIPLAYLLYYEIGRNIMRRENLPVFMIIMAFFQMFGNVSIYTNETFFLTRTWQGKAVAGALVIPALFWVFLLLYDKGVRKERAEAGLWILLVGINMTAGVCSSIAVFLVCILIAAAAFCLAVVERDWKILFKVGAACVPNVIYMAVYVFMAYSYLLK